MSRICFKKALLIASLLVAILLISTRCSENEISNSPEIELIVRDLCEYPGSGIYVKHQGGYYSLEEVPGKESDRKDDTVDYERWNTELGSFFAERCFDAFYNDSNRTVILDNVAFSGLESTVDNIREENIVNSTQRINVTIHLKQNNEEIESCDLSWRIIFSSDGSGLIQKIELEEYADFFSCLSTSQNRCS